MVLNNGSEFEGDKNTNEDGFKIRLFDWSKIFEHHFENHCEDVKNGIWKDMLNRQRRKRDSWTVVQSNISHFTVS